MNIKPIERREARPPFPAIRLLLLLPFLGLLWVPFYDRPGPALLGFPFFYWYQLAWVPLTSLLIWIVWKRDRA